MPRSEARAILILFVSLNSSEESSMGLICLIEIVAISEQVSIEEKMLRKYDSFFGSLAHDEMLVLFER